VTLQDPSHPPIPFKDRHTSMNKANWFIESCLIGKITSSIKFPLGWESS